MHSSDEPKSATLAIVHGFRSEGLPTSTCPQRVPLHGELDPSAAAPIDGFVPMTRRDTSSSVTVVDFNTKLEEIFEWLIPMLREVEPLTRPPIGEASQTISYRALL